jgi:hypothetical protein
MWSQRATGCERLSTFTRVGKPVTAASAPTGISRNDAALQQFANVAQVVVVAFSLGRIETQATRE